MNVLAVDDERFYLDIVKTMLENLKFRNIHLADSANEALVYLGNWGDYFAVRVQLPSQSSPGGLALK